MSAVQPGRVTEAGGGEVTVFLIGMRFNRPLHVRRWAPVFVAMPRMLTHLTRHPEHGMLWSQTWLARTTIMLSYWRSPEHLQRFAADTDSPHLAPWRAFQRRARDAHGAVGIWHETYVSRPGQREVIYVDMPPFGLAGGTGSAPVDDGHRTARQRLTGRN